MKNNNDYALPHYLPSITQMGVARTIITAVLIIIKPLFKIKIRRFGVRPRIGVILL